MTTTLNPYLSFPGTAREAMTLYQQVLGGTLEMNTFGEYGAADQPFADQIMHATLETPDGLTLMGSDMPPGEECRRGNTMSVSLSGDDAERLRGWWAGLSEGGTVTAPLEKQMWGDEFGMCADRFGVTWMVNISGDAPE
ncbi:VOC family protein [Nocardioides pacificus]